MRTFTLPVIMTQEDVDHGLESDCIQCPFALAIRRALAPFFRIKLQGMFSLDATILVDQFQIWKDHTNEMKNWIRTFDYSDSHIRDEMKPFPPFAIKFNLNVLPISYHIHFNL